MLVQVTNKAELNMSDMTDNKKTNDRANAPHLDTTLTHSGNHPEEFHGFVNPPVVHASTVLFPNYQSMITREQRYTYGTRSTPTTDALTEIIDELEGSAGTILVPSGLAAVSIPLIGFTKAGDHILVTDSVYRPTRSFCDNILTGFGVEVEYYDPLIGGEIANLIRDNTSVVFTESPASNTFEIQDIPAIAAAAHAKGAVVMMDNTWATPVLFKCLDFGVDISIHALTKYPGGHSDLVMGSVSANERCWNKLYKTKEFTGVCASGDDCNLVIRGFRSMGVRLERHAQNALEMAQWLEAHPACKSVLHPGLPSHPQHDLFKRDFNGASGLFGFQLNTNDIDQAAKFLDALELIGRGYSWGGYESLAVIVNLEDRTIAKGPQDGILVRLQVGLEHTADLMLDLERGFSAAGLS